MKVCNKCNVEKELNEFHKWSRSKDGRKSICKACRSEEGYVERASEEHKEKMRINAEKRKPTEEELKLREEIKKEKASIYNKEYRGKHKDKNKNWRKDNPDRVKEYRKRYTESDKSREHRKRWYKSFKERNPHVLAWRTLLNNTVKRLNTKKDAETIKLLGYSAIELKEHIESLFLDGMSWDNYGKWHIDHIKMLSTFDKDTPIDVINALSNLRPLWESDNCSKKYN